MPAHMQHLSSSSFVGSIRPQNSQSAEIIRALLQPLFLLNLGLGLQDEGTKNQINECSHCLFPLKGSWSVKRMLPSFFFTF